MTVKTLENSAIFQAFQDSKSNEIKIMVTEIQSREDQRIEHRKAQDKKNRQNKDTLKVSDFVMETIEGRIHYLLNLTRDALGWKDKHNFIAAKDKIIRIGEVGEWRFKKLVTALKMMQFTTENCHTVTCSYDDSRKEVLKLMGLIK